MTIESDAITSGPESPKTRSLVRTSASVGFGTALSRATGLVRVVALAYALGYTTLTDTYNLANTTPNILYELILGGIFTATLVPVFVRYHEQGDEDSTNAVMSVMLVGLFVVTGLALITAPLIMRLFTLGSQGDVVADQRAVGTLFLLCFLPQILFYGLTSMFSAWLNARRSFFWPSLVPVLNNMLVAAMLFTIPHVAHRDLSNNALNHARHDRTLVLFLGLGTTAGVIVMTIALLPALRKAGWGRTWRFAPNLRHPAVRYVGRLSGWTVGYVAANQLALFVVLALARRAADGGVSAYQAAFMFFQMPHALVAVSVMTTILPDFARRADRGDLDGLRQRFAQGLRLMSLVIIPSAAGYVVLARPIVDGILKHGRLTPAAAGLAIGCLRYFAIGLFPFAVYLYSLRAFYALQDTRTPFLLNCVENGINIVLAFALVPSLGVKGLALAHAGAYTISAVLSVIALSRRVGTVFSRFTARSVGQMLVASTVMALLLFAIIPNIASNDGLGPIVRTIVGVALGTMIYVVLALALRLVRIQDVRSMIPARFRRHATSGDR